jgi:putative membrane protein
METVLEGTLTDAVSKLIIENAIVPRLRVNDFTGGINRGVEDIIQAVSVDSEEWRERARQRPDDESGLFDVIALLFFLFIFFMVVSSVSRQGRQYAQAGIGRRRGSRGPIIVPIPGSWGPSGSIWSNGPSGGFWGGGGSFGGGGASGSFLLGRTDQLQEAVAPGAGNSMVSSPDKKRIVEAIRAAEEKTAVKFFCVIANACGGYRLVPIAWAAVLAFAMPLPLIYLTSWPAGIIYLIQLSAFIVAALVLSFPVLRFRIVPKSRTWERAHAKAMHQFLAQGVHLTEQRTGMLIFASVAERYAEIIADVGVDAKISPEIWTSMISTLISTIKDGRLSDGLVAAINLCGEQFAQHFPPAARSPKEQCDPVTARVSADDRLTILD